MHRIVLIAEACNGAMTSRKYHAAVSSIYVRRFNIFIEKF